MRPRDLSRRILLALALIAIGATSAHAIHPPVSHDAGDAQITVDLLDGTTGLRLTPEAGTTAIPKIITYLASSPTAACHAGDGVNDPLGSTVCPIGGITFTVGGATVQITDKSKALARMIATPGSTSNDLAFKNFVIKNNLPNPVVVVLTGEFNFPDSSGSINGSGRAHGLSCKAQFFNCTSGACFSNAVGDLAQCNGEFVYFDDNLVDFQSEFTGALAGQLVTINYEVGTTFGSNTMGTQCVAEGSTSTTCPNTPTVLTPCPNNFGTCLPVENVLLRQIYVLNSNTRVEVGAGNKADTAPTCAPIVVEQESEFLLEGQCAIHANESLNLDSGCVHVEVYGDGPLDLSTCDFTTARFGAGGTELAVHQVNCGQDLNGVGGKNDCFLSFCPSADSGFLCGDGSVTAQLTVTCDVPVSCQDAVQQGKKVKVVGSTDTTASTPLVCTMPGEVTPCKK